MSNTTRDAFEAWATGQGVSLKRVSERENATYTNYETYLAYHAWQAATEAQATRIREVPREPVADTVDSIVAELVAGLQRAQAKRKQRLSDLPAGTCETCMGEGYLGSIESQRITDCPDCIGGVRIAAAPSTPQGEPK